MGAAFDPVDEGLRVVATPELGGTCGVKLFSGTELVGDIGVLAVFGVMVVTVGVLVVVFKGFDVVVIEDELRVGAEVCLVERLTVNVCATAAFELMATRPNMSIEAITLDSFFIKSKIG